MALRLEQLAKRPVKVPKSLQGKATCYTTSGAQLGYAAGKLAERCILGLALIGQLLLRSWMIRASPRRFFRDAKDESRV